MTNNDLHNFQRKSDRIVLWIAIVFYRLMLLNCKTVFQRRININCCVNKIERHPLFLIIETKVLYFLMINKLAYMKKVLFLARIKNWE